MSAVKRVAVSYLLLLGVVGVACSNGGDGSGDYEKAQQAYEQVVAAEAKKLAETEAPVVLQELAAVGTEGSTHQNDTQALFAVMSRFREQGTASGETLCTAFKLQAEKAGSGETGEERLEGAKRLTRQILRDTMLSEILNQVASSPPETSDKLFELLGVSTASADGTPLRGRPALQNLGLLDASGKVALPTRGTQQYEDYERWLRRDGTNLQSAADGLTGKARDGVDDCKPEAN